jgi:phage tail tape-measure protein
MKSTGGGAFAIRGIATELRGIAQSLTIAITALAAGMALVGRQSINMAAEFENLKVTMEVLSGSVEEADRLIRDLKEFAATTPLSLRDVEQGATTLVALGESTDDVIPKLRLLGQAAVALNRPLDQLIRVRQQLAGGVVLARSLQAVG